MRRCVSLFLMVILIVMSANAIAIGEGKTKVTVWCWDPAFNIYAMEEAAKIYADINPDVQVEVVETAWDDVQTKLITAVMAGQTDSLPDILLMQDNALQKNVTNFPGVFADLTDSGINFADFAEYKVAVTSVEGRNYAVPFDNGTTISALRRDILEEAGFSLADFTNITWAEYIEKAKVVLEKTGKPLGSTVAGEPDHIMLSLQSAGSWLFDKDGNIDIADNDVLKEILETYVELVKSGVLVEVNDWERYISSFNRDTVAGTMNGCWIIGSIVSQPEHKGLWGITTIPRLEKAENATHYSNQGGSSWVVLESSPSKEQAIDFLKNTFAGSVELYETILPSSGALATYLPAGDSEVYGEPHEFFAGQAIYAEITDYASKVPQVKYGIYNYEARDAVGTAIAQILAGMDIDLALQEAEETVKFLMGP